MKLTIHKKIQVIIVASIVFIAATIISSYYLLNGSKVLKDFKILSLTNDYTEYTLKFESVPAAIYYKVTILDERNVKIFEEKITDTTFKLDLTKLDYGKSYSLMVYAINESGEIRPAREPYLFTWLEPSINEENSLLLRNEDYTLLVDGELVNKDYVISITNDEKTIVEEKLTTNEYLIPSKYFKDEEKVLNVKILSDNKIVDMISLFNNVNPVNDIKIITPELDTMVNYTDVSLKFDGGDNALEYTINIYNENDKLIKKSTSKKHNIVLAKGLFKPSSVYRVEVIGSYEDYSKSDTVTFSIADKGICSPVYISNNWKSIKKGTKITLKSDTEGPIYYTLNGENPESMGTLYTEPITINEDVTLKAVATNEDLYNSIVKEYNIKVKDKEELKIFISPSNQVGNLGVSSVGYTNERDEMNDVANYVVERLKKYGVTVYRNNPATGINYWIKDSNYYGVDAHIAIHSNASVKHNTYGVETWVNDEESESLSLAHVVQNNLMEIYPYKDKVGADRGVKYAHEALGEVNTNYLPFGLLVEIAHHDYKEDADWIMKNKKLIGYNIADSILKYYQIID